jgi:hypothetical protein
LIALAICAPGAAQVPEDLSAKVQAHLEAGEIGLARQVAQRTGDAAIRDQLLGQIARRQAAAGMRQASIGTLGDISDDRYRGQSASDIGLMPIGGLFGGRGGAAAADFDTLIELITTTIAPDTWDEVGGPGAIESFPTGVYVDASGTLKKIQVEASLVDARKSAAKFSGNRDPRRPSAIRKVSLTRLEKLVQLNHALGKGPDDVMQSLAGLQRVKYVFLYPESADIVIAGPAGDWHRDAEGRLVGAGNGDPVLQLDDFVVLLRHACGKKPNFGCAITPRQENLARTKAFLEESAKRSISPSQRERWLADLRNQLGKQDIEVFGVDPRTRVARVLVEADYRMKLVGMGLEEGTLGVSSYLDSVKVGPDGSMPPMDVLRWWFTMNYDAIRSTEARDAFEIKGQGVRVLSENEMLSERGERIHTGKSDELNRQFTESFTTYFDRLADKYPIYADLRNVFDLALVAALICAEDLAGQASWHMTHFGPSGRHEVALGLTPREVDTVINHRVVNQRRIVAGVSGGVSAVPGTYVTRSAIKTDDYGVMKAERDGSAPKDLPRDAWWWD